ncbi:hypothetical protein LCGC14_2142060 [marine sediment metagenome]|uniref:Uncharacterized protein n=1 Tax=marine sediment metagenome TaxID=412755 RepID=A0A0F9GUB6_9ZZZZ
MKVSIYEEKPVEQKEQELFLKLVKQEGLDIFLVLVDSNGEYIDACNLLRIHPNLEISRCRSINKRIGLPLTLDGQLKIKGIPD